ncbi:MAG: hypothetical protein AAF645_09410 [Myxococcota bacterium]
MTTSDKAHDRVAREDVLLFLNGCFAATGQRTFYRGYGQRLSIAFLHTYMLVNYRPIYALMLAAGINDFNAALVVRNLLRHPNAGDRRTPHENALIAAALRRMPPQRVYRLFSELRRLRVNNRRTRAAIGAFLRRRDLDFDALKYRNGLTDAVRHSRFAVDEELGDFLFHWRSRSAFERPLLEAWRAAHYAKGALYDLPFTVAEGFAARHRIPRSEFLERIKPRMTKAERERTFREAERLGVKTDVSLARMPLLRATTTLLAMDIAERRERRETLADELRHAAKRAARGHQRIEGRVALVLDSSHSMRGVREQRQRPLAVALSTAFLLDALCDDLHVFPLRGASAGTTNLESLIDVRPIGATSLADATLRALRCDPALTVIASDGHETNPPGAIQAALDLFHAHLRRPDQQLVHANPAFDPTLFSPRTISAHVPTLGVRDPADLLVGMAFVRFATGVHSAAELEAKLERIAAPFMEKAA